MSDHIILYAEDEFSNQELLRYKFKNAGIPIDIVADGREAIDKCREKDYSVVILDNYMDGMDGIEAAKEIRKIKADMPLIAITSDDNLKPKLLEAGFDRVVIKPLRGTIIVEIVKSFLV